MKTTTDILFGTTINGKPISIYLVNNLVDSGGSPFRGLLIVDQEGAAIDAGTSFNIVAKYGEYEVPGFPKIWGDVIGAYGTPKGVYDLQEFTRALKAVCVAYAGIVEDPDFMFGGDPGIGYALQTAINVVLETPLLPN